MDASHIFVGVLTLASFGLLVWLEIRSRRNTATLREQGSVSADSAPVNSPTKRTN
jgi:hypothetical protein